MSRADGGLTLELTAERAAADAARASIDAMTSGLHEENARGASLSEHVARCLVEAAGGRLTAGPPGAPALLTVSLRERAARDEVRAATPRTTEGRASRRVLVVDDDAQGVAAMTRLLRELGGEVRSVTDGPTALAVVPEYRPDLVLIDLRMPVMDGFELAQELRRLEAGAAARLVALSGFADEETRRRALSAGFDDHAVKPSGVAALRALLARL